MKITGFTGNGKIMLGNSFVVKPQYLRPIIISYESWFPNAEFEHMIAHYHNSNNYSMIDKFHIMQNTYLDFTNVELNVVNNETIITYNR